VLRAMLERAEPANAEHLESATRALAAAGAIVTDVALPASFVGLHEAGNVIVRAEAAAHHAELFSKHHADYPPRIREAIEAGGLIRAVDYLAALRQRRAFRDDMGPVASGYDALLLPAAAGPAPRGLDSTGDPYFCAPWSLAGMPALALPSGLGADGLPLALQLVGAGFAEARLLRAAAWCERVIGFASTPAL
jgi:amidase